MERSLVLQSRRRLADAFKRDGLLHLPGVLQPKTAYFLLLHVNALLRRHYAAERRFKEQKDRADCQAGLVGVFGAGATTALLARTLDACAADENFGLQHSVEVMMAMMETDSVTDKDETGAVSEDDDDNDTNTLLTAADLGDVNKPKNRWDIKLKLDEPHVCAALSEVLPRVRPIIEDVLGCSAELVELSCLVSEPGAECQPLHADTLWTAQPETVTCFIALQDITPLMGPTLMLAQTHAGPSFWQRAFVGEVGQAAKLLSDPRYLKAMLGTPLVHCCANAGAVFLMDSRLLHCGSGNESNEPRILLYFSFRRASMLIGEGAASIGRDTAEAAAAMSSRTKEDADAFAMVTQVPATPMRENERDAIRFALRKITKTLPPQSLPGKTSVTAGYAHVDELLAAPLWWVHNGGESHVSRTTLELLDIFQERMGSTLSLRANYVGRFTLESLCAELGCSDAEAEAEKSLWREVLHQQPADLTSLFAALATSRSFQARWSQHRQRAPFLLPRVQVVEGALTLSDVAAGLVLAAAKGEVISSSVGILRKPSEELRMSMMFSGVMSDSLPPVSSMSEFEQVLSFSTVTLHNASEHWRIVAALARAATIALGLPVNINIYVTAAGREVSTPVHADGHNVLVLQTQGRKRWRVFRPLPRRQGMSASREGVGELIVDVTLQPGECLFVPAGFPHLTSTHALGTGEVSDNEAAVHLTIGFLDVDDGLTYGDLRGKLLSEAGETSKSTEEDLDDDTVGTLSEPLQIGCLAPARATDRADLLRAIAGETMRLVQQIDLVHDNLSKDHIAQLCAAAERVTSRCLQTWGDRQEADVRKYSEVVDAPGDDVVVMGLGRLSALKARQVCRMNDFIDFLRQVSCPSRAHTQMQAKKENVERTSSAANTKAIYHRQCVVELYDDYAEHYDKELDQLKYTAPKQITGAMVELLRSTSKHPAKISLSNSTAVDLGCGTGLMGVQMRRHCLGQLHGCDLSRKMLKMAKNKGVYDLLQQTDAVRFLSQQIDPQSADLIVAAEVLEYIPDLVPLLDAAQKALCSGGIFAYTTELCTLSEAGGVPPQGSGWVERPSERVAHCLEYSHWLVARSGGAFRLRQCDEISVRHDGNIAVKGLLVILERGHT